MQLLLGLVVLIGLCALNAAGVGGELVFGAAVLGFLFIFNI